MSRDALVVGINKYNGLPSLESPAKDAEAIAQLLEKYGNFRVRRLPETAKDGGIRVAQGRKVSLRELREELIKLFCPDENCIPDTALLYFSGHGLRQGLNRFQEGFLATSDVNVDMPNYGLSLKWLRGLLQESPVRQQIVWLDCCHSGELFNFQENLKQADPGNLGEGRDRSFIAASRGDEAAYAQLGSEHSLLTQSLLKGLDPNRYPDGRVTNYTLRNFLEQALKSAPQCPIFEDSAQIILTGSQVELETPVLKGTCPYKGLSYFDFDDEDPKYFYGRDALTNQLVEQVREKNFLAVVGASGSGKSSVVRAGLLYQLKLGQRIFGSEQWSIYIFRPGEHPLQSLAEAFLEPGLSVVDRADQLRKAQELINSGAIGLGQLIVATKASRIVLVIDQFEECFTLCRDSVERQQFFENLLSAVERSDNKLCLVLTMRADFFGKCLEQDYGGLAKKIEENLVTVTPLNSEELEQAITQPAKQVGLEVEDELVTQMITDVEGSPGSLPLLQYTLTELWKHRAVNWLTLSAYNRLGGVRGTLQKRADEVYEKLLPGEKVVAKRIFLELTQLGEGTEDTRRQVLKKNLVTPQHSEELVERVLQTLADAKLVVTSGLREKAPGSGGVAVVDVAHEALIRYWPLLHQWVEENREALRKKRSLEEAALEWMDRGKPEEVDYLLRGAKLAEAEEFLLHYVESIPLPSFAQEFIVVSQVERDRLRIQEENRRQRELEQERKARKEAQLKARFARVAAGFALAALAAVGFAWQQQQQSQQNFQAFLLGIDPPTSALLRKLPDFLHQANQLRDSGKTDNVNLALAYYRKILTDTIELSKAIADNPKKFQKQDVQTIQIIAEKAEKDLVLAIKQYRLPQLNTELTQNQVGVAKENVNYTDFEGQFTAGALRTTYAILLRQFGVKADLNDNGKIDDEQEAKRMPCSLLTEIQIKWYTHTQGRCNWYGENNDAYNAPDCSELNTQTLVAAAFAFPYDSAIDRLRECGVIPKQVNPNP